MPRPITPAGPDGSTSVEVPTWTNVLITEDMPIEWKTETGEPEPDDELAGRLVIGHEQQLVIDLCGKAATNLMAALLLAHHEGRRLLPPCPGRGDSNARGELG